MRRQKNVRAPENQCNEILLIRRNRVDGQRAVCMRNFRGGWALGIWVQAR